MNPQYQPNPAYPGFQPGTQPPPGMPMMDPNMAQLAQQRYMQQHREQLAAMHAAGMMAPGPGYPGGPGGHGAPGGPQGGMRMPPGMPPMGMAGMPGPGGPSSHHQQMQQHAMHATPPAPKQKKKPGPQPRQNQTPASQMMPQPRQPPTTAEQYMKNAMAPPANHNEVEPWADALDELDPRELAMGRFRTRNEMMEEVFGPEPIKNIPLGNGDAWAGLGIDGETLEAKVTALEKENDELEQEMEANLEGWRKRLQDIDAGAEAPTLVSA